MKPVYLDCNATTPMEAEVLDLIMHFLKKEYGNSGSRTHAYGYNANKAVEEARNNISELIKCEKDEVIFTSGATESNNLALLGIAEFGKSIGKTHIISTSIEHKAVLEPLDRLSEQGFDITLVKVNRSGRVKYNDIESAIQENTLLVSVMQVNNETGIIQPISKIADLLKDKETLLHVDAAQGFGKEIESLQHQGVDLISLSGHKIYGPKGIGALIKRRRKECIINPLFVGGGQEKGLRPGTLPVHLIAGLGKASELAMKNHNERRIINQQFKNNLLNALNDMNPIIYGNQDHCLDNVVSLAFGDIDSEALMLLLKNEVAISNGSACTSNTYEPSHVLTAIGLSDEESECVTRWSWSHLTKQPNWENVIKAIETLKQ